MEPDLYKLLSEYQIILASASPRRKHLLNELGINFSTEPSDVSEDFPEGLQAGDIALHLAELKADSYNINNKTGKPLIIAADTIVWLNNKLLGKPQDFSEGVKILTELSGEMHTVFTGVCLRTNEKKHSFLASTDVYFKEFSKEEIHWYLDKFKPWDKAGAYGAQEWIGYIGIKRIEGSYFNVMGLPTQMLWDELHKFLK